MTKRTICDISPELVGKKILRKVPITSLGAVRSTCKLWNALSRDWILGSKAAAARQQFIGFLTMISRVCSMRFDFRSLEQDLVDVSIKPVDLFNIVDICRVIQCEGLLLCVSKHSSRLLVWNPYSGQTRWIGPRTHFHRQASYALGYDKTSRNHKILWFLNFRLNTQKKKRGYEIYDLSSGSDTWRVLDVTPEWDISYYQRGVSLKGNTYFFAYEKLPAGHVHERCLMHDPEDFLICFDFTSERFGPRLPLPFHSNPEESVILSCVGQEQLAALFQGPIDRDILEIWVTTKIEHNSLSWSRFLKVDLDPITLFQYHNGSFFIDEEKKLAVVFAQGGPLERDTTPQHRAFIVGDDGFFKTVSLEQVSNDGENYYDIGRPPVVCSSSYLPSLEQIDQPTPRKRKERDEL